MEELENGSLSENDMTPGQEEGEDPGQQEGPADGNGQEQEPGEEPGDDTGHPDEEGQETQPVVVIEDGGTEEWREGITERLTELMKPADNTDVTERLDALIQMLTPEEQEEGPEPYAAAFSFDGYTEWDYPVTMQFMVYPYGAGYWMENTEHYGDADSFQTRYDEIVSLCGEGGTLKDFYVQYIWDSNDELIYDYEAQTPEPGPDPGGEEQDETTELLLSYLESMDNTIGDMEQAVVEYCQTVMDYQAEMLQMMAASTATDIFICIGVFAIFAALVWQWLFGRFR